MQKRLKELILLLASAVMVFFAAAAFAIAWRFFYVVNYIWPARHWSFTLVLICAVSYGITSELMGGYKLKNSRVSELVYSHAAASIITGIIMYIAIWMFCRHPWPEALPLIITCISWVIISIPWAKLTNRLTNRLYPPVRTLVLFSSPLDRSYGNIIANMLVWRFKKVGCLPLSLGFEKISSLIKERHAKAVLICGAEGEIKDELIRHCLTKNISVYLKPSLYDCLLSSSNTVRLSNYTMLSLSRDNNSVGYTIIKRLFDIVFSIFCLIILSPLFLVLAVIIKIEDRGRVIFKQERLTINGRKFIIYKFRTMKENAEEDSFNLASKHDPRITITGKFLRKSRLDELPQLVNILKGEMSFVGPRPERPELTREYEKQMPGFSLRLQAKAGLTGYAQVYGRYNTAPMDKLAMDLIYIADRGIYEDFKLMLTTVKAVFIPESSEGVEDE